MPIKPSPPRDPRRVILASASPRRKTLLTDLGFRPEVWPANVEERPREAEPPLDYVLRLAKEKATEVGRAPLPDHVSQAGPYVLAADTIVVLDEAILEKPSSAAHAATMLRMLSGARQHVITGIALYHRDSTHLLAEAVTSTVEFVDLDADTIERYVRTGEPMDKAGAYGIQGLAAAFVRRFEGSYTNIVGLPVMETVELMKRAGAIEGFPFEAP